MKIWSICASISATITDIWTKFGTEHKFHTTNTLEWPNSHKLKIQDGGGRHLEFRKNVNNFGLEKDILHQIVWKDASRRRGDGHVTKILNQKLIRVTSSNEVLKQMCVDLSDYNRYLNQISYRTQIPHYQHAGMAKFTQTENRRWRRPPSWISDVGKMSITLDWIKIYCIILYGKMHHDDAEMTTWPKVEIGS